MYTCFHTGSHRLCPLGGKDIRAGENRSVIIERRGGEDYHTSSDTSCQWNSVVCGVNDVRMICLCDTHASCFHLNKD